jgi:hypothetical protein
LLNADGTEGIEWFNKMDALAKVLAAFEFVSFVLTAAIIQQDLLVGTTSFWMTRPISGARLLRAKLLSIGLVFIVAPVLVTLPWWLGCRYGLSEIGWAVAETVAAQAIAVLLGLLWSVVTDGFARFLMWTLVTLFATPMLTAIIGYALPATGVPAGTGGHRFAGSRPCPLVSCGGVQFLTEPWALHHHRRRRGFDCADGAFWPAIECRIAILLYLIRQAQGGGLRPSRRDSRSNCSRWVHGPQDRPTSRTLIANIRWRPGRDAGTHARSRNTMAGQTAQCHQLQLAVRDWRI